MPCSPTFSASATKILLGGVRVADDHAGDGRGDQLVDRLQRHLPVDLALGEEPVRRGSRRRSPPPRPARRARARAAGAPPRRRRRSPVVEDLDGRVGERHRPVGGHRQHLVVRASRGRPSISSTPVMPKVERPVASTTGTPAATTLSTAVAHGRADRPRSTTPVPWPAPKSVPSMSRATSFGVQPSADVLGSPAPCHRLEDLAALQVGPQRLGHAHRPVGLLVGLEDRHDGARHRARACR